MKTKNEIIDELRMLNLETLQNDFNMQKADKTQTDKVILKKEKNKWKRTRRIINSKLNKIQKEIRSL